MALHCVEAGWDVHVISGGLTAERPAHDLGPAENRGGVTVHRVGRARADNSFHSTARPKLGSLTASGDLVVATSDPPLVSAMAAEVAARVGARLVNWVQDVYPEGMLALGAAPPGALALARLRDTALRAASANVAIGSRMAGVLNGLGAPPATIRVIPNWADDRVIRPLPAADNPLRRAWGLGDKFVVGYSGNLGRAHEIGTVLLAAEQLRERPDIRFLFVGGGELRGELERAAAARGLSNIVLKPYQPAALLNQSLAVADVHWVSLRPELEGLVVPSKFYANAAAGRPIIAVMDGAGELAEIVRSSGCGFVVPVGDGAAFARAIETLADEPSLAIDLGRAARTMIEAQFSRSRAMRRWTDLLDELRGSPSSPLTPAPTYPTPGAPG